MHTKKFNSFILENGQVVFSICYGIGQLSAKFQVWARQFDLTDAESLACWIANQPDKHQTYFTSSEKVRQLADFGFSKLAGVPIPDLTDLPQSEIRHSMITMEPKSINTLSPQKMFLGEWEEKY